MCKDLHHLISSQPFHKELAHNNGHGGVTTACEATTDCLFYCVSGKMKLDTRFEETQLPTNEWFHFWNLIWCEIITLAHDLEAARCGRQVKGRGIFCNREVRKIKWKKEIRIHPLFHYDISFLTISNFSLFCSPELKVYFINNYFTCMLEVNIFSTYKSSKKNETSPLCLSQISAYDCYKPAVQVPSALPHF